MLLLLHAIPCRNIKWPPRCKPFQDEGDGEQRGLPTSFSPATSQKVGINLKNLLTFSFNLFVTLV